MKNIYVDLDGVIFDYDGWFKDRNIDHPNNVTWDVFENTIVKKYFNKETKLFENLEELPFSKALKSWLDGVSHDHIKKMKFKIKFLTFLGTHDNLEEVAQQKVNALNNLKYNNYFNLDSRVSLAEEVTWYHFERENRKYLADKNSLLFDDHLLSVREFRKNSGEAYLVNPKQDGISQRKLNRKVATILNKFIGI